MFNWLFFSKYRKFYEVLFDANNDVRTAGVAIIEKV